MPRPVAGFLRFLGYGLVLLSLAWTTGALWFSGFGRISHGVTLLALAALTFAWFRWPGYRRRIVGGLLGAFLVALLLWQLKRPAHDRDWSADMARLPIVEIDGDIARVSNVRDCVYRTSDDYDVRYRDEVFDLGSLRTVDFMVERFHPFDGLAHTLLSFGFADGRYVAISVEIRRERGEAFGPIAGLFKEYELMYVVATERDLIGLRTNVRRSRVWLYPIRATPAQARALFEGMLRRAQSIATRPEFYDTLTNSCTTNLAAHVRELAPGSVPPDWRILLPGYSGELIRELGLIDTDRPLDEGHPAFRVDPLAQGAGLGPDFSARIRSARPK